MRKLATFLGIMFVLLHEVMAAQPSSLAASIMPVSSDTSSKLFLADSDSSKSSSNISLIPTQRFTHFSSSSQAMIVGVPLRQQNDMSVEVRKDFRAPERVRNWLRLGLENHHFVYMRFGITPFENLKTKKKKSLAPVAYRHLDERYGPSFGFSLGLNSRMSVEAEYQPEFAFKDKTSYSRVNSRLGNAWRRIDRLDTFRIRFSLKLYSNQ